MTVFTYRESTCFGKRFGIIEIGTPDSGYPCIVESNDMAPTLQKDQLWARKGDKNVVVAASDSFSHKIYSWFGPAQKQAPETRKEVKPPPARAGRQEGDNFPQDRPVSYATAVQEIPPETLPSSADDTPASSSKTLLQKLGFFQKGHFVLVCGSLRSMCRNIEALSLAPWIAVYDFDFRGRDSGLLSVLEDSIKKRRSLTVTTWRDPHSGITERGTQWWSLRGRRDIPDSKTSDTSHVEWLKQVREKLDKLCQELARFSEDYTVLTVMVLLPSSETETRCMHDFLTKLQEHTQTKIILCHVDQDSERSESKTVQMMQWYFEDKLELHHISLVEFCTEIDLYMEGRGPPATFEYRLPAVGGKTAVITDKDVAWLAQDLEVLFLENPHTNRAVTTEDLQAEADNFFRGGTISWHAWYDMEPGCLDVKRSISKDVTKHIKQQYIDEGKNGMVTLYHAPGAGGSTMAQRVLWDLHEVAPCVHVKTRTGSSMEETADRLVSLHNWTHLPVIALLDGEDEARLKQLLLHLQRNYIVIIHVKRYPYRIDESRQQNPSNSKFYLPGVVNKRESRNLVLRFSERCNGDTVKKDALAKLDKDVQDETEKHQMYEYGMTVYHHEFRGVRSYVRGYLRLEGGDLASWQKCLGFLSLVYYYGQSSFPCQFVAGLLGMTIDENRCVQFEDLPEDIKMFVVPDGNEGRGQYVRICHYVIAKEILEQILTRSPYRGSDREFCDVLSSEARRNLKDFCIEFITLAAKKKTSPSITAQTITYILTKTFIFRDNKEVSDIQTQECQTKRKPHFSQILSDVQSDPPYNKRLEVLQTLCKSFPDNPNFRAHLGRFYTCCRWAEEEEAEKHFKEALRLCYEGEADERTKLNLMQIYHMYGMFFQVRIAKYFTFQAGDDPNSHMDEQRFDKMLSEVVANAERACQNFMLSRQNTPLGHEESYTYINEIHVRLQTCEFVRKFFPGNMRAFLSRGGKTCSYRFVKDCITEIEDLIMECFTFVLLDNVLDLQKKVQWFNSLFSGCAAQLQSLVRCDDLTSLRLNITAKKLKFRGSDNIVSVESLMPPDEIGSIIRMLESIFQHENIDQDIVKSKLELDYKDWILAIRNPNFGQVYSLEKVLEHVQQWHGFVHSPQSTFYLFILYSLLGFGTRTRPGPNSRGLNLTDRCELFCCGFVVPREKTSHEKTSHEKTSHEKTSHEKTSHEKTSHEKTSHEKTSHEKTSHEKTSHEKTSHEKTSHEKTSHEKTSHFNLSRNTECLVEAKNILEERLQKLSKMVVRPRCPREWLGRDNSPGIRRLVSSSTVGHIEDRSIKVPTSRAKLAVCKGTIRPKNKKVAGYIDLDLGENTTPVKVFYVPVLCDLEGSRYSGQRVQFHLAFTLDNGYEAYEVTLLDRYRCDECHLKVEMTRDEEEMVCSCGAVVVKNEYTRVSRTPSDDDQT
nr:hypothetical protein BaRGS_003592 [Batillaria attramentaria]